MTGHVEYQRDSEAASSKSVHLADGTRQVKSITNPAILPVFHKLCSVALIRVDWNETPLHCSAPTARSTKGPPSVFSSSRPHSPSMCAVTFAPLLMTAQPSLFAPLLAWSFLRSVAQSPYSTGEGTVGLAAGQRYQSYLSAEIFHSTSEWNPNVRQQQPAQYSPRKRG